MSVVDKTEVYSPVYHDIVEISKKHERSHWTEDEVKLQQDVEQWKTGKITEQEKLLITNILRLFTQSDMDVGGAYYDKLIPVLKNNDVRNMLGSFAAREAIHQRGYALLTDTLGFDQSFYHEFLEYSEMREKHEFFIEDIGKSYSELGKYIAKQVFMEGVSLFASFAILLNFDRIGKLPGMCDLNKWSIADESCFPGNVEILTGRGWKSFESYVHDGGKVAQYNSKTKQVSFTTPVNVIDKPYSGDLVEFSSVKSPVSMVGTKDHDFLYNHLYRGKTEVKKVKFEDFKPHFRRRIIVAGNKSEGRQHLSPQERVLIALQADGTIPKGASRDGSVCGYRRVSFSLTKDRKKVRLDRLCKEAGFNMSRENVEGREVFYVDIPVEYKATKLFSDWVNLEDISSAWGMEFVEELMHWDGHDAKSDGSVVYYSSVEPSNVDVVQAVCAMSGLRCSRKIQVDNRKDTYKDVHRAWIYLDKEPLIPTGCVNKEFIDFNGRVYCVTVPDGNIIIRHKGNVAITGNCHSDGLAKLFRVFCEEHPRIVNDEFKRDIYESARQLVALEDKFIDKSFSIGGVEGLTPEEIKQYVRYVADYRLNQLGFKSNWNIKENPIPWIDWITGTTHGNFFEREVSEYSKANLSGTFEGGY